MKVPSDVINEPGSPLGALFPHYRPEPELLVYEYVREATGIAADGEGPQSRIVFPENEAIAITLPAYFDRPPELDFYPDREGPAIPVARGWPAYPGKIPAIGIATGSSPEDSGSELEGGGFVGELYALDDTGAVVGSASYFAQTFYSVVIVELIHENRDERDRLHERMRPVLARLRRVLPDRYPLLKKVRVDDEKQEVSGGPPESDQPFTVYVSLFTVHVWFEALEAVDVTGTSGAINAVEVTADPTLTLDSPDLITEET